MLTSTSTACSLAPPSRARFLGRPAGRPVLLLPGPGGRHDTWRGLIPHLTGDHLVLLVDQPELRAPDLGVYGDAAALLDLVRGLDLSDVVLVGHSAGAVAAVRAAQLDPAPFAMLVLVAPDVDGPDLPPVDVPALRLNRLDLLDPARMAHQVRSAAAARIR